MLVYLVDVEEALEDAHLAARMLRLNGTRVIILQEREHASAVDTRAEVLPHMTHLTEGGTALAASSEQ